MMLVVPALWWLVVKRRRPEEPPPYGAFSLIMLGFLVDVTGNSLDLYDSAGVVGRHEPLRQLGLPADRHRPDHRRTGATGLGAGR